MIVRCSKVLTVLIVSAFAFTTRESAATVFFQENFDNILPARLPWNSVYGDRTFGVSNFSFTDHPTNIVDSTNSPKVIQILPGEGRNGTNAGKLNFWNDSVNGGVPNHVEASFNNPGGSAWAIPPTESDVYVRFYAKFAYPWPPGTQIGLGMKLGRFHVMHPVTGATLPGGSGGSMLPSLNFDYGLNKWRVNMSISDIARSTAAQGWDYNDVSTVVIDNTSPGGINALDGNYHCFEYHLKLNTPGVANGVVEFWVDGRKIIDDHIWKIRDVGEGAYTAFWTNVFGYAFSVGGNVPGFGTPSTNPAYDYLSVWFDDIVVSDTYNGPIGAGDATPPSAPTGLTATAVSSTQINISWNPSTDPDDVVAGYSVYRNGAVAPIGSVSGTTYNDTGLTPGTPYSYEVSAYDTHSNTSSRSPAVVATTLTVSGSASSPAGGGGGGCTLPGSAGRPSGGVIAYAVAALFFVALRRSGVRLRARTGHAARIPRGRKGISNRRA